MTTIENNRSGRSAEHRSAAKQCCALLLFVLVLLAPTVRANTNVSATLTVTNVSSLASNSITVNGTEIVWTNTTISALLLKPRLVAVTNTAAKATTNLYTKLRSTFGNRLFINYGSDTSLLLRGQLDTTLTVSNSSGWASLVLATNTVDETTMTGKFAVSNLITKALTLGADTITDFDEIADIGGVTDDELQSATNLLNTALSAKITNATNDLNTALTGVIQLQRANGAVINYHGSTATARGSAILAAQTAASSGDTISIFADAVLDAPLGKSGLSYIIAPTATLTNYTTALVSDGGGAMTFSVRGGNLGGYLRFTNSASRISIEAESLRYDDDTETAFSQSAGTNSFRFNEVNNNGPNTMVVAGGFATLNLGRLEGVIDEGLTINGGHTLYQIERIIGASGTAAGLRLFGGTSVGRVGFINVADVGAAVGCFGGTHTLHVQEAVSTWAGDSAEGIGAILVNGGTLNISIGTVDNSAGSAVVCIDGTLNLNGGKVSSEASSYDFAQHATGVFNAYATAHDAEKTTGTINVLDVAGAAVSGGSGTFNFASLTNKPTGIHNVSTNYGANLTNLNGSSISSGTVADARLSSNVPLKNADNNFTGSNYFGGNVTIRWGDLQVFNVIGTNWAIGEDGIASLDGSGITNLSGSSISSGTVADARLSSNVPLKDTAAVFTAAITATSFTGNGSGLTNAVDLISGSNITITTNANKRSFTIAASGSADLTPYLLFSTNAAYDGIQYTNKYGWKWYGDGDEALEDSTGNVRLANNGGEHTLAGGVYFNTSNGAKIQSDGSAVLNGLTLLEGSSFSAPVANFAEVNATNFYTTKTNATVLGTDANSQLQAVTSLAQSFITAPDTLVQSTRTNSLTVGWPVVYTRYTMTNTCALTNVTGVVAGKTLSAVLTLTNSTGTDYQIFLPAQWRTPDGARSYYVTNQSAAELTVKWGLMTNAAFTPVY